MKSFTLAAVLAVSVALASARPQEGAAAAAPHPAEHSTEAAAAASAAGEHHEQKPEVKILNRNFDDDGKGNFKWSFENSDGSKADAEGHTSAPEGDHTESGQVITGSYSYVGPDGKTYQLSYVADQHGFQPKADFLPVAPVDPNHPTSAAVAAPAPHA